MYDGDENEIYNQSVALIHLLSAILSSHQFNLARINAILKRSLSLNITIKLLCARMTRGKRDDFR